MPADVAAFGLRGVERAEEPVEEVAAGPVNASAIASGTVGLSIMFACTDQPGPVR